MHRTSNVAWLLGIVLLVVIVAAFYWLAQQFVPQSQTESATVPTLSVSRIILTAVALLIGILFGSLHRIWRERREAMSFSVLRMAFLDPELWRSFLAAPLVFSGVYAAAQAQPDVVVAFFFAFQCGFFSDAVVQGRRSAPPPPPDPAGG